MKNKKYFIDGTNLTDQEFLYQWAEIGAENYCNPKLCNYVISCLKEAKTRISDIMKGYIEKSGHSEN